MTDDEKLELLWAAHEERRAADARLADTAEARPLRATADPRPPFDWSPFVKALTPILLSFVLAVLGYYGVNIDAKVQSAAEHAKEASKQAAAAVVQGEKNEVKIERATGELQDHGKKLDRMGNAVDRVPGKGD